MFESLIPLHYESKQKVEGLASGDYDEDEQRYTYNKVNALLNMSDCPSSPTRPKSSYVYNQSRKYIPKVRKCLLLQKVVF